MARKEMSAVEAFIHMEIGGRYRVNSSVMCDIVEVFFSPRDHRYIVIPSNISMAERTQYI